MKIEQFHIHQHPLTLFENEREGTLLCPSCNELSFGESYNCSCWFHPERCITCDGKPSGSFYICEKCWPYPPFFHKSCAELPQKIQIAHRPHCTLQFKEEHTSSEIFSFQRNFPFDCDFCSKSHKGDKFCCALCDFQIGAPCATILIKYHQGRQHMEHFRHHHPLVLLEMEVDDTKCHMCRKVIDGQSYCCVPCEFYIHKSCSELLEEVQHPFHPGHYLTLQNKLNNEYWRRCDACNFKIDLGMYYGCDACDFDMHLECMSLKPNIKYQGHHHLLTLMENMSYQSECHACGFELEGAFFVRCVECNLNFHIQCGPISLPPILMHENHNHPLSLIAETLVKDDCILPYCDICKEERNLMDPSYGCVECEYYAHVRCVITEIQFDETEKLKHFSHDHVLFLIESNRNDDIKCYACEKLIYGHTTYGCDPCRFYLHKSCFELPKVMYHKSHSHYLTLGVPYDSEFGFCKTCGTLLNGLIYRCERCDFNLDLECASQHPSIKGKACNDEYKYNEDREDIGHYSHYHHLTLSEVCGMECKLCFKNIRGLSYVCAPCMFYIHKSCAELPQEVRHPFHPRHCLTVQENTFSERYICDACRFNVNPGIRYRCDCCDFDLHLECVSLKPNIKYQDHQHLLILVENMSHQSECKACRCKIEGTFFVRCVECNLNFHVQCGSGLLPPTVVHQHHDHPLILTTETIVEDDDDLLNCEVCQEERNPNHPSYSCVECEYYAHVHCVVTNVLWDERLKLEHFSHEHSLFLVGNKRNDDIMCCACEKLIQADPAYGCHLCRFYLHNSCAEFPKQIQHLLHRHPLILKSHPEEGKKDHKCSACHKMLHGFTYQCQYCDFFLDLDCASLQFRVTLEGDDHILTLFEKLSHIPECQKYGAAYVHCLKCNFSVHLMRSPLPQTVEYRGHPHSLTLVDNLVDDNYETQICDVCEEERDPVERLYYCAECDFITEFNCVILEVILALQKKSPDVPLRSFGRNISVNVTSKSLTYQDIDSFTDEEYEIWFDIENSFIKEKEEILTKFSGSGHETKVSSSRKLLLSDEDLLQSLAVVSDFERVYLLEVEDYKYEVIDVGDYKMIPKFAGVLRSLLDKYGDIGASCNVAQSHSNIKMCLMVHLCATVHSMCNTMIQDVNDRLLYTWWRYFRLAHRAGFKVDIFFDHLKRIALARQRIDTELHQISAIHYHYEEMAKLSKEIDELAQEIDKRKTKLAVLRKQTQNVISYTPNQRMRSEAERLSKAREFGMMKAGVHTGLL